MTPATAGGLHSSQRARRHRDDDPGPGPVIAAVTSACSYRDVLEAGEHQGQLIEALLTLAGAQRGLDRRDRLDLAAITRDALDARRAETAARGLAVTASLGSIAPVAGDARLLERLACNLIDNAIRHNIPGGQIRLHVTASGRQALRISNTGPVIPADQVARLLQPFQRQPAAGSAGQDGLGLGLSIAAAIAKAHDATLTISPDPHGGLDISITFPRAHGTATAPQAALVGGPRVKCVEYFGRSVIVRPGPLPVRRPRGG